MTSGTFAVPDVPLTLGVMRVIRRIDPDAWGGLVVLAAAVVAGGPVLAGMVEPFIGRPAWTAVFLVMIVAIVVSVWIEESSWPRNIALVVAVLGSWTVVLGTPGMGFLSILLVVMAALSVYMVPLAATVALIAGNTVVLVIAGGSQSGSATEVALGTGIYLLLQIATVMSATAIIREQGMRRRLTEAHVDLQAASVLLAESARTAERLRISRDLHDAIGHQLTVLTLELEAARHRTGEQVHEHVERADAVARELLHDVRSTVSELRAEPADLDTALTRVVQDVPGLQISVDVDPEVRVGEPEQVALLRAVQEVVTNTLRHADARELWIEVRRHAGGDVVLTAVDDGRGVAEAVPGNGLRGMIERFDALGGEVGLDGSDGFRVTARMPVA